MIARACVVARPPVRPSARPLARPPARPPARSPARPSARVWGGGGWDLAGIIAAIAAVVPVPVVADNPAGAVIEP